VGGRLADRRIRLLLVVFAVVFAVVLVRAAWLQTVRAQSLGKLASTQQQETRTIPAGRGTILDRMGVPFALGEVATTVYANPREIRNARAAAAAAEETLGVSAETLYPDLLDRRKGFVYVARKADPARAAQLERRGIPGFGFYPEERRVYPQGRVASQLLGYAGIDNSGLAGVEKAFDRSLTGRPGKETFVRDPFGRPIDVISSVPERDGHDVVLTVDHNIQANAEAVLSETVSRWHAKRGTAIVLDPRTGGILAMAVAPGFDANNFNAVPAWLQRNTTVTDTYEPGSTFKLVTVAGVLSEGLVTAETPYTLPYTIPVADRVIHDAEPRGTVTYTVGQILSHSSNVGAVTLAKLLGSQRLAEWVTRFGFGEKTGIDFPGESEGIVLPLEKWSGSTIGTVPIGQGIAVTPIQMAAAYAAVANGGEWLSPHVVDHVVGRDRRKVERRRVVSSAIARQLLSMLVNVVADPEATGTQAALPGYQVAGKTGTAAKPEPGGYSTSRYVASFVGIVPASKPRLVILVTVDEPQGTIWGGVVAAPAFREIARFDLQYLEVPPDASAVSQDASRTATP
jgi:cell division protein FtsI (penicillin-binding protein 3)